MASLTEAEDREIVNDDASTKQSGREVDEPAGPRNGVDRAIVAAFEEEIAAARRQADENWDRYLRAEAELDNVKKRQQKLRDDALAQQKRDLLARVLDVADNLSRALDQAAAEPESLREGIAATQRDLARFLAGEGVERIEALGEPFDPLLHEATAVVPMPDLAEERIIGVDRAGYTLGGILLRPARVVVGRPADPPA